MEPPSADQPFAGRYDLLEPLGQGGMGAVYRAWDRDAQRHVAIKLLRGAQTPTARARLLREGAATAALKHPGIVRVHDAGETEQGPYLVYELVPGAEPLSAALPRLDRDARLALYRQVVAAMAYAHARDVVHRDLKPENVLVDEAGGPRVVDFGLGWLPRAESLTQAGALLGSPHYMAPEQIAGGAGRGATTDVWSLGVVLYLCLTDALPFEADSLVELSGRICAGRFVSPRELDPTVPAALEALCARCLQVDPTRRFPDASALGEALAGVPTTRAASRSRSLALLVLGAGCAGALGLLLTAAPGADPGPPEASFEPGGAITPIASAAAADPQETDLERRRRAFEEAFTAARAATGKRPFGFVESSGERVRGWVHDEDSYRLAVLVTVHVDGPEGRVVAQERANRLRLDAWDMDGRPCRHAFDIALPPTAQGRPIFVRAQNLPGTWGTDAVLERSSLELANLDEPASHELIHQAYRRYLGRDADPDGLKIYGAQLRAGMPQEQLGEILMTSEEFGRAHPGEEFVEAAFRVSQQRAPEPGELDGYVIDPGEHQFSARVRLVRELLASPPQRQEQLDADATLRTLQAACDDLLELVPDDPWIQASRAFSVARLGQAEAGLTALRSISARDPDCFEALLFEGEVMADMALWKEAWERPAGPLWRAKGSYGRQLQALLDQGDLAGGERLADRWIRSLTDPHGFVIEAWYRRSDIRRKLGRFAAARADLSFILEAWSDEEFSPADRARLYELRASCAAQEQDWSACIEDTSAALDRAPPDALELRAQVLVRRAEGYRGAGDLARARVDLLAGRDLFPADHPQRASIERSLSEWGLAPEAGPPGAGR